MYQRLLSLLLAVLCLAIHPLGAACQTGQAYPAPIPDFAQWDKFPAECAGHRRGTVTAYAPAMADYSVGYDGAETGTQSAVTLYFYPRLKDSAAQLKSEEAQVLRAHPDGHLVNRRQISIRHKEGSYDATLVTFEFGGVFRGKQTLLSSQLLIVFLDKTTLKVRSTSPVDQAINAEASMREILQCVAWPS